MNIILAGTGSIGGIVLMSLVIVFLAVAPFIMRAKSKKEAEFTQQMHDAIKKGDTVLTASGVIGKVVSIDKKEGYKTVTIETGNEKTKSCITFDIEAVYANLSNPFIPEEQKEKLKKEEAKTKAEQKEENSKTQTSEKVEVEAEAKEETKTEEVVVETKEEIKEEQPLEVKEEVKTEEVKEKKSNKKSSKKKK